MKKKVLFAAILICSINSFAQFTITGKLKNHKSDYKLEINVPFIYGYYAENTVPLLIDDNGNFKQEVAIDFQKFALFNYGNKSSTFLLTPGKSLLLEIDCSNDSILTFGGNASAENKLLIKVKLGQVPFFSLTSGIDNPYATLPLNELQEKIVKPWMAKRDEKLQLINSTNITQQDKLLIASEIKYESYARLSEFAMIEMDGMDRQKKTEFIMAVFKNVSNNPDVFPAGPQYYNFVDHYLSYLVKKALVKKQDKNLQDNDVLDYFNISLDSANKAENKYGKRYVYWMIVRDNFDKNVAENYLAQNISNQYNDKDLMQVKSLMGAFATNFPKSTYLNALQEKLNELEKLLVNNSDNTTIKIIDDYQKVASIYDVIKPLKGKTVYLDIWGTWCGPCKQEFRFNAQLKAYFKNKDVVFVYLDMDDDNKETEWKDFIKVNSLTGVHLRKSRKDIQQIWNELLPNAKEQYGYPSYFIFDKEGKLAVANAMRPSQKTALYTQIESVLNK